MSDDGFIAGTDLYQGGKRTFQAGDHVPAGTFPPAAEASLRANGGLRAFRAEGQPREKRLVTAVPPAAPGDAPASDPSAQSATASFDPRSLKSREVQERVRSMDSAAELEVVEKIERSHPDHEGGRTGVLNAIEAQRQRLLEGTAGG